MLCLSWVADTKSLRCLISDFAFDIVELADLHPCAVGLRLWVGENLSLLSDCGQGTSRL